jgi:dTDP-4-dehydrorhamnose 3,5-epimerase
VGLHYHLHQADYWYVPFGHRARVVLHDLREGGPTDGATCARPRAAPDGESHHRGVYIPPASPTGSRR